MDDRGLEVVGGSIADRKLVGGFCLGAMDALEYASTRLLVEIRADPLGRPGVEASAHAGGIFVSPALLPNQLRLLWILSEEVAHRFMNEKHGIPHGGVFRDRFAQEGFACWFQCRQLIGNGLLAPSDIQSTPITVFDATPQLGHDLGKHVAAAHWGSASARAMLDSWFSDSRGAPRLKQAVKSLPERLPLHESPPRLAWAVEQVHAAANC